MGTWPVPMVRVAPIPRCVNGTVEQPPLKRCASSRYTRSCKRTDIAREHVKRPGQPNWSVHIGPNKKPSLPVLRGSIYARRYDTTTNRYLTVTPTTTYFAHYKLISCIRVFSRCARRVSSFSIFHRLRKFSLSKLLRFRVPPQLPLRRSVFDPPPSCFREFSTLVANLSSIDLCLSLPSSLSLSLSRILSHIRDRV